ncbi:MAG TPA: hypothetical protein VEG64_11370 [Candidatus Sulfotelmatobacter sp.]|nr:hypothetical protein [Candidatus Sulfotelmatobacter sp.]
MIELILFLSIGIGLLVLLFALARRPARQEGTAQALVEAKHALRTLQESLVAAELVERIFDQGDWKYVASAAAEATKDEFLRDRKKIAVAWTHRVKTQILSLKEYHFRHSRFYSQLNPATEFSLALSFAALLQQCRLLQLLLIIGGPYAAPALVGRTAAATARICAVSEKSLAFLNPATAGSFGDQSPEDGAAVL